MRPRRVNYLGEWHSHPSFSLEPSERDRASMRELMDDPDVGADFLVLMVTKIEGDAVAASLTVYLTDGSAQCGTLLVEEYARP